MSGRLALRDALDHHGQRTSERHRVIRRGTVEKLKPLTIQVLDYDHPLTLDDDFDLSQWGVWYQKNVGFKRGDLVLLHQEHHDWVLFDVVSDSNMPG